MLDSKDHKERDGGRAKACQRGRTVSAESPAELPHAVELLGFLGSQRLAVGDLGHEPQEVQGLHLQRQKATGHMNSGQLSLLHRQQARLGGAGELVCPGRSIASLRQRCFTWRALSGVT